MSKNKKKLLKKQAKPQPVVKNATKEPLSKRLPHIPVYVILFFLLWIFCGVVYGDVFYMAEQSSYFAFDRTIMSNILSMWDGYFILVGRFLLTTYHYPLLGGLVMALILTLSTWLLAYVTGLKGRASVLPMLWPFVYLGIIVYKGLNLYYQHEPGYPFAFLVLVFAVLAVAAVIVCIVAKRKLHCPFLIRTEESAAAQWQQFGAVALLFVALFVFAVPFHENTRATAKMQRLMWNEEWDEMIDVALSCSQPSRSVCCYYAIALEQTDQLVSRLFDIHYQYPDMNLTNMANKKNAGTEYYVADGDFFAGLVNTSYHDSMERFVCEGPSIYRLKRMFLCALINGESALAEKYLRLIGKAPFENRFVEKYNSYINHPSSVRQDPLLAKVSEILPLEDDFEQKFRPPLFIGYNVDLRSGRCRRALDNSLMACLYAKMMDNFYERTGPLLEWGSIPRCYEEALTVYAIRDISKLEPYRVSPLTLASVKQFYQSVYPLRGEDKKTVAEKLKPDYGNIYPYYYFYENIPDDNYPEVSSEKGGVN